jgi:ATP-binding cassette subfamily C protein
MLKAIKASLAFMSPKERSKWYFLTGLRALLSILDLVGILAIGFVVTSTAIFLTSGSDPNRVVEFAGLQIPAVNAQTLPWVSATVLLLFLSKALFSVILTKRAAFFVATVEARSARTIAEIAFGGDLGDARKRSREEMMYAIQGGSPSAFNVLLNAVNSLATETMLFVVICLGFLFVDPWATLGAVLYFGLIAFIMQYFVGSLMTKAGQIATEGAVAANTAIGDLNEVLREATILGKKNFFFDKIHSARIRTASSTAIQLTLGGMPRYIVETALIIAVALFVLWQSASGDLVKAAGTLGIFLSGGLRLTASLLPLQGALLTIKQSIPVAEKALKFLTPKSGLVSPTSLSGADSAQVNDAVKVELQNVSFDYPDSDSPTLVGVDISIKAGQQVALIGPSGAGKSTLADLMLGLLKPSSGYLMIDGQDPDEVAANNPGRLGYVPQRPGMISGTVAENIALGVPADQVDQASLSNAIASAHLKKVLAQLPEGVHTNLGKRKDELSGGQLQRIGLARALYSKPGLLVMDEATSALDADSENEINKALDEMRGKVTVVLIAHRLNTVQRSDVVFLVEEGRVTASGTFPELLKSNKTVQNLAKLMSIDDVDN